MQFKWVNLSSEATASLGMATASLWMATASLWMADKISNIVRKVNQIQNTMKIDHFRVKSLKYQSGVIVYNHDLDATRFGQFVAPYIAHITDPYIDDPDRFSVNYEAWFYNDKPQCQKALLWTMKSPAA